LTTSSNSQLPHSFSPDGKTLVLQENTVGTGLDLRLLRIDDASKEARGKSQSEPLIARSFNDLAGGISPDGHWLAYDSDESGGTEVYVRPFPNVQGGRWQVSTAGGMRPAWSSNGREIFYLGGDGAMMAASVQLTPTFSAGAPAKLFGGPWFVRQTGRTYDVSRDGQRFLMIKDSDSEVTTSTSANLVVIVNWSEDLKQRVPTK
jgi:hypothetical protein